eukprot:5414610-Pyramimonas_sp.AAC.1
MAVCYRTGSRRSSGWLDPLLPSIWGPRRPASGEGAQEAQAPLRRAPREDLYTQKPALFDR